MSRIIEIPGGQATIRSPEDVKQKGRRRLEMASVAAQPAYEKINAHRKVLAEKQGIDPKDVAPEDVSLMDAGITTADYDAMYEVQAATILAYLEEWTLAAPLPQSQDDLDELPVGIFDALREGTSRDGADAVAPVDFSPNPTEGSPTGDDSGFSKPSEAELQPGSSSTQRSPSTGGKPHIAASTAAATMTT